MQMLDSYLINIFLFDLLRAIERRYRTKFIGIIFRTGYLFNPLICMMIFCAQLWARNGPSCDLVMLDLLAGKNPVTYIKVGTDCMQPFFSSLFFISSFFPFSFPSSHCRSGKVLMNTTPTPTSPLPLQALWMGKSAMCVTRTTLWSSQFFVWARLTFSPSSLCFA